MFSRRKDDVLFFSSGNQVSELFFDLNEIDYDKAFAISSEVIAMEIINRLLITVFEVCVFKHVSAYGHIFDYLFFVGFFFVFDFL